MSTFWQKATQRVHLPAVVRAESTLSSLSYTGRALFMFFAGVCVVSSIGLLYLMNRTLVVATPARGGSLTEGIIGSPRFINPILAVSDADRDLTALVYSGLLHALPDGSYVPDLAESYVVSPDGKTYTFVIRPNATFQDGSSVTAEDVVYTVQKIQDPALKSPALANWQGVTVRELDSHTVTFVLRSAYSPFIENLTLGIVPKQLWQDVPNDEFPFSELNTSPVGSGPYQVSSISRTASGIPSSYRLRAFNRYMLGEPYLTNVTFKFYQSETALEEALSQGDVESASGLSPANLDKLGVNVVTAPLNRVFGVFFNQNQSEVLRLPEVRAALNSSINRTDLVQQILGGYGVPLEGPVPPALSNAPASESDLPSKSDSLASTTLVESAQQALLSKGWKLVEGVLVKTTGTGKNQKSMPLRFTLATANVPELRASAQYLKTAWEQMGAQVEVQVFDQSDLSQNVIRRRAYDALLFGEVVGRELDLFAFWHSSQRNDPGLNIAAYANATADKALESLRTTTDPKTRQALLDVFSTQVQKDLPAVFLYAPDFVYSIPNDIAGASLGFIETPSDRFLSVAGWHRETDYVWPVFASGKDK
ncbi:MAG: ABC transporter substrate-binding protein [Patescibacteria group bacterium]